MATALLQPIVEGHGEVEAVPTLFQRIWMALGSPIPLVICPAIRCPKSRLVKPPELQRMVELACRQLRSRDKGPNPETRTQVLVLLDADDDCPKTEIEGRLADLKGTAGLIPVSLVYAVPEFETWFVGAAESLGDLLDRGDGLQVPPRPEESRQGKGWIERNARGRRYSPTVDQKKFSARIDLETARRAAPSFDKLWRELQKLAERCQGRPQ